MGIKFLASTTLGSKPTTTEIGEREIAFNLADGKIYTNNGSVIVELGADAAGVLYNASLTYPLGSIVSNGGIAYVNITPVIAGEAFDAAKWKAIGVKEVGGLLYDPAASYSIGDMVSDGGKVYISKTPTNVGNTPSSSPANWDDTTKTLTYISTFLPNAGLEYPAAPAASTYYMVNGLTAPYVMSGGDLSGSTVHNGDELIWDGIAWTSRPGPIIPAEHGGIAWTSGNSYKIGDLVSYNMSIFIALQDSHNVQPDSSLTDWADYASVERAGVAWASGTLYIKGDAVVEGNIMYVALADHTAGGTFTADAARWSDAFIVSNVDPGTY